MWSHVDRSDYCCRFVCDAHSTRTRAGGASCDEKPTYPADTGRPDLIRTAAVKESPSGHDYSDCLSIAAKICAASIHDGHAGIGVDECKTHVRAPLHTSRLLLAWTHRDVHNRTCACVHTARAPSLASASNLAVTPMRSRSFDYRPIKPPHMSETPITVQKIRAWASHTGHQKILRVFFYAPYASYLGQYILLLTPYIFVGEGIPPAVKEFFDQ